jgi:nicotinamidase-related amidase
MATALLCIDVQNAFRTNALAGSIAEFHDKIKPDYFISVIYRSYAVTREKHFKTQNLTGQEDFPSSHPCVSIPQTGYHIFSSDHSLWLKKEKELTPDSNEDFVFLDLIQQLPPELRERSTHLVSKTDESVFFETHLEKLFHKLHIDKAYITGAYAEACISATIEDMKEKTSVRQTICVPDLIYCMENVKIDEDYGRHIAVTYDNKILTENEHKLNDFLRKREHSHLQAISSTGLDITNPRLLPGPNRAATNQPLHAKQIVNPA